MNKDRRKRLEQCIEALQGVSADIEAIMDEEQEAHDNLPDSLQDSEQGERMQEAIDGMQEAIDNIESCVTDKIQEVIEQ